MSEYEEKFIVINRKRFDELSKIGKFGPVFVESFQNALKDFISYYEGWTGKKLNQKYYVVNQDEPYADDVIKIILDGETVKESINE